MKYLLLLLLTFNVSASEKWTKKLFKSIDKGDVKLAAKSIRKGAYVDSYNDIYNGRNAQNTALTYSLKKDRTAIAKMIVDAGADLNLRRSVGEGTAAMVAARRGNIEFLNYIKDHNDFNVNTIKSSGRNALFIALWNKQYKAIEFFLSFPSLNLNQSSVYTNRSVLERSIFQRDLKALNLLLNHRVEIDPFSLSHIERAIKFCEVNELENFKKLVESYKYKYYQF